MVIPVVFKSLAFWKGISLLLAGVLALLVVFNVAPANYGLDAGVIFAAISAVLQFLGVTPELKARGLLNKG